MRVARRNWRENGVLLVGIAILFWAGNLIVGRGTVGLVSPLSLALFRWLIAGGIALILARRHLRRDWPALCASWPWLIILSATGISGYNTLLYVGLQTTTAINGFLINTTIASLVALVGFCLFGDRLGWRSAVGLVIAMAGVVWVVLEGNIATLRSLTFNLGDIFVFAGVLSYSIYTALLRKRPAVHPMAFIAATFLLGSLFLIPFWIWESLEGVRTAWTEPLTWVSIAYLALFPSLLSYLCFNSGVALLGANRASALLLLTPLVGILLAMVFLGEMLRMAHVVGAALIFTGLSIGRR